MAEVIVVYNDPETLRRCFLRSRSLDKANVTLIDNSRQARGLPALFNAHKLDSIAGWLIFCHQDFIILESEWLERIVKRDTNACYGPIGVDTRGSFLGQILQTDGSLLGRPSDMAEVIALDEMCLIVPRRIYSTVDFDERFPFDFYVHDYCFEARRQGFDVRVIQLDCQHKSNTMTGAVDSPRYLAAKRLLIEKHHDFKPLVTTTFSLEAEVAWLQRLGCTTRELLDLLPTDAASIIVDEDQLRNDLIAAGRSAIPFLDRDGQYWGPPGDDETAILEFERVRQSGASLIVFAWPALWWLDCYPQFHRYLRSNFRCVRDSECVVAFALR